MMISDWLANDFLVFVATEYYNPPDPDDVIIDYGKSESNIEENTFIIFCVQASLARDSITTLSAIVRVFLSMPVRRISIHKSLKSHYQFYCLIYSGKTSRRIP